MKRGSDGKRLSGKQRLRKDELYDIYMLGMIFSFNHFFINAEIEPVNKPPVFFPGEVKVCSPVPEQLVTECCFVVFICIWPYVEPDKMQGIRGVIGVLNPGKGIQAVISRIQAYLYAVIHLLLPVMVLGMQ